VRPSPDVDADAVFECLECGARSPSSDSRTCGGCGGPLQNLAVERDL